MLQYATNVFRGTSGRDGISGALFMANLASGEGGARASNPYGYLFNDVGRTYEGQYLNIAYDRSGSESGETPGAQYKMNFEPANTAYGDSVTGYYSGGKWTSSGSISPALDCIGFVNLVSYAAGALNCIIRS
jgi:hypothetical protein